MRGSVTAGNSSQTSDGAGALIVTSAFGILGYGAIWAYPSPVTFALAMVGPLAVFHATNSMLFGNVRAHSDRFSADEAGVVTALMREAIANRHQQQDLLAS